MNKKGEIRFFLIIFFLRRSHAKKFGFEVDPRYCTVCSYREIESWGPPRLEISHCDRPTRGKGVGDLFSAVGVNTTYARSDWLTAWSCTDDFPLCLVRNRKQVKKYRLNERPVVTLMNAPGTRNTEDAWPS